MSKDEIMWTVNGRLMPDPWLDFEPVRVLYSFDGPRIFTCKDSAGNLFLAFQCDEDGEAVRFLVVPLSDNREQQLTAGEIDVRSVLSQEAAWLFDLGGDWTPR